MMTPNGPPTPKGVGGPSPPLVSRGSEEGWEMEIPTLGFPSEEGGRGLGPPPTPGGVHAADTRDRRGYRLGWEGEEGPLPNQQETRDHSLTHIDRRGLPSTGIEGVQGEGRREDSQKGRAGKLSRQPYMSRELRMLDHSDEPLQKRVRRPARELGYDNSCEVTRNSNMICPITCGCHNSLLDISKKTRVVSDVLRSTRKIWKNELIAVFGFTSAIMKTDEIKELKQAQEKRNSDLYRTSIQYTVLGKIHGREVYLIPPQDAALLLQDRISPKLRKSLKQHNSVGGVGQLANHTCCDTHWNANLEVASIEHHEETDIEPMGILRAKHDIEQDTEILTRYWHNKKDAWRNIFVCECCACTNHTRHASGPPELDAKPANGTALSPGHPPSTDLDLPTVHQKPRHNVPTKSKQDYPDSEIDSWDWDELEASPPIETSTPIQTLTIQPSIGDVKGIPWDLQHIGSLDHGTDPPNRMCPFPSHSMLQIMASIPDQSFPEPWQPVLGALVEVFTGGDAQQWRVSHIKKGIGTSVTITHKSSVMIVDKGWFMFDTDTGRLVLQRLGFFGDNHLKRTTNSYEMWCDILHPDRMMDGEILTVLLEWIMQGHPGREELGLQIAKDTSWLVHRKITREII